MTITLKRGTRFTTCSHSSRIHRSDRSPDRRVSLTNAYTGDTVPLPAVSNGPQLLSLLSLEPIAAGCQHSDVRLPVIGLPNTVATTCAGDHPDCDNIVRLSPNQSRAAR